VRLLDSALLAQLEGRWHQQGAEIAGCLAPGLTVDEIDTLVAPFGLDLPQEARTWWGGHNRVTVATPFGWEIGPDIGFYSLPQALDEYRYTIAAGLDDGWPSDWLPLVQIRARTAGHRLRRRRRGTRPGPPRQLGDGHLPRCPIHGRDGHHLDSDH
jgi:hypothetical protein